ncbi:MarR family winged helix-turn-helix transcriptional regulator [Rhodococcus antarcticus]|uniref:MarR family winged helix-turn-helix transcriptional regulator n=1 Tax=Rhodococcus antarcticus TaxID=2987751 RepID=A0ABY6NYA2_9NOCA|nr:MarR family winged helix-turn-helix transcriptional regulator [Rhodococcus antarcticus]UZJ24369.1 MarR family winged helix-turn-helix transcriptional regulator [Rhodococcus antarcticus]
MNEPATVTAAAELNLRLGRLSRLLRRSAAPGELSPGATSALATLVRGGRLRQGELAAREQVAPPTMSRIVASLELGGHVVREADPGDGRATLLVATPAGRELVTGVTSARVRELDAALAGLDPGQRRGLLDGLAALEAVLSTRPAGDQAGGP